MKAVLLSLLLIPGIALATVSSGDVANANSADLFFDSYVDGVFKFMNEDGEIVEFQGCKPELLKEYDLVNDEELISMYFKVTWTVKDGKKTITGLEEIVEEDYYDE
jgi:hypothetical protein